MKRTGDILGFTISIIIAGWLLLSVLDITIEDAKAGVKDLADNQTTTKPDDTALRACEKKALTLQLKYDALSVKYVMLRDTPPKPVDAEPSPMSVDIGTGY